MRRAAERKAQLAVIARATEILGSKLPLKEALDETLALILNAAGSSFGAIYLAEPNGKLTLQSQIGWNESDLGELQEFFDCAVLLDRAMNEQKTLRISSPQFAETLRKVLQNKINAQSLLIAPLIVADEPQGVLVTFSARSKLGVAWVNSVKIVARQLAQAVLLARSLARDITQGQLAEEKTQRNRDRMCARREIDLVKEEFFSVISHELRTP
jgi:signal transduction histidine kinase